MAETDTPLPPAPASLVGPDGRVALGRFAGAPGRIGAPAFDYRTGMGARRGRLARAWGFKRFEFVAAATDDLLFGAAVVHLGYVSSLFAYAFVPSTGELVRVGARMPLGLGTRLAEGPETGETLFVSPGLRAWVGHTPGRYRLRLKAMGATSTHPPAGRGRLDAEITLEPGAGIGSGGGLDDDATTATPTTPMSVCTPVAGTGFSYTHKLAGVPARGWVRLPDGRRIDLDAGRATGQRDYSAGYLRRETFWNWASLAGRLPDGRRFGLNLSWGVNESGYSENAVWLDGRLCVPGQARFAYDRDDLLKPWRIWGEGFDLNFAPAGLHAERLNALVAQANFRQVFGRFAGWLDLAGERVELPADGLWGFAEEQYARW